MKAVFLLFALVLIAPCFADNTYYISPAGNDTDNGCTDSSNPCATLLAAINAQTNSSSSYTVEISAGNYTGPSNILDINLVSLPAVSATFQKVEDDAGEVIFNCAGGDYAFFASAELTVEEITISNCAIAGILLKDTDNASDLTLTNVTILDSATAVYYQSGGDLEAEYLRIVGGSLGVHVTNATEISIDNSYFAGITEQSIQVGATPTEFSLDESDFEYTAGITFNVGNGEDLEGEITNSNFIGIISNTTGVSVIAISGGSWELNALNITSNSSCNNAIGLQGDGNSTLTVEDTNIDACYTGIFFQSFGSLTIKSGTISTSHTGLQIEELTTLNLEDTTFVRSANNSVSIESTVDDIQIEISGISASQTGPAYFNVPSSAQATIENSVFDAPTNRAIYVIGGHWGLTNVTVSNGRLINNTEDNNGGALYFTSSTVDNVAINVTLNDLTITNCGTVGNGGAVYSNLGFIAIEGGEYSENIATNGGAIYVALGGLSIEDATFANNTATGNGGAIEVSATNTTTNVYLKDITLDNNSDASNFTIFCLCTGTNTTDCITLVEDSNDTVDPALIDPTCNTITGDFETQASDPDPNVNSNDDSRFWWLLTLLIIVILIIVLILVGVAFFLYRKKQASYSRLD